MKITENHLAAFADELRKIATPVGAASHLGKAVGLTTSKYWPHMLVGGGATAVGWKAKDFSDQIKTVKQLRKRGY